MRILLKEGLLALSVAVCLLIGGGAPVFALPASSEATLLKGIDLYESGQFEEALETFTEVIRMGSSAEDSAMAKEYVNRISFRLAGKPIEQSPSKTLPPKAISVGAGKEPAAKAPVEQPSTRPTTEAMAEYFSQKLRSNRTRLIEGLKKQEKIWVVMKGTDKLLALSIPESLFFAKAVEYKKEAGAVLNALTEIAFFHPKHLIRVYPALSQGRSTILNLQRATILASDFSTKGLAPPRVEVDLEGNPRFYLDFDFGFPKALEQVGKNREGNVVLVFEEFSDPFHVHYFFTKYLPKVASQKEYPTLSLGISNEKVDARLGQGTMVEVFVHSNKHAVAHWSLRLIGPDKTVHWVHEGSGSILETFYFEGKQATSKDFEMLATGKYSLELEAMDIGGGRDSSTKIINVIGREPVEAAQPPPAAKPPAAAPSKAAGPAGAKRVKKGAAKASSKTLAKKTTRPAALAKTMPAPSNQKTVASSSAAPPKDLSNFKIVFGPNETRVGEQQMSLLAELAQTAKLQKPQRLSLIGSASPEEDNAESLAESRARKIAKILTGYGIEGARLNVEFGIGEAGQRQVEVFVEQ
ncbi:MAG: hypothetical protein HY401_09260 [Elusimicrobia bacterium]|nr:hypothetical protein [Elusimicrobiota bacterium]